MALDTHRLGFISASEFHSAVQNPRIQAFLETLNLESYNDKTLFHLLDMDGSGFIDADQFVCGCARLKGHARSIDLAKVFCDMKKLSRQITALTECVVEGGTYNRFGTYNRGLSSAVGRSARKSHTAGSLESEYYGCTPMTCASSASVSRGVDV